MPKPPPYRLRKRLCYREVASGAYSLETLNFLLPNLRLWRLVEEHRRRYRANGWRDDRIRELRRAGVSARDLARKFYLSEPRIYQILKERT